MASCNGVFTPYAQACCQVGRRRVGTNRATSGWLWRRSAYKSRLRETAEVRSGLNNQNSCLMIHSQFRRRHSGLSLLVLAVLLLAGAVFSLAAHAAQYQVAVSNDVMVVLRDGVKLATDIYLPVQNGAVLAEKLPVILTRTPYNKS